MNSIFITVLSLSVSGTLLAGILFILKPFIKNRLSKTWQYYIWLIILARLLLPFSGEVNILDGIFAGTENLNMVQIIPGIERTEERYIISGNSVGSPKSYTNENLVVDAPSGNKFDYKMITNNLWVLWLSVAISLFLYKIILYRKRCRNIRDAASLVQESHVLSVYQQMCSRLNLNRPPRLYRSTLVSIPTLIGTVRPCIVLPDSDYSANDLKHIFLHEVGHYKRLDILYKWLVQIVLCIHWFNPMVHWLRKEHMRISL